jgi:hypothetical protein
MVTWVDSVAASRLKVVVAMTIFKFTAGQVDYKTLDGKRFKVM